MTEESLLGGQPDTESASEEPKSEETLDQGSGEEKVEGDETKSDGEAKPNAEAEGDAEDKKKEDAEGAPEQYEKFTFENQPEGAEYDQDLHDTFAKIAKEDNLTQAQAQKYVSLFEKTVGEIQKKNVEVFNDARKQTLDKLRADKELGGPKFDATVKDANMVLRTFDPAGVIAEKLKTQRYVTDADLIPMLAKARAAMSDDSLEDDASRGTGKSNKADYDTIGWTYKDS